MRAGNTMKEKNKFRFNIVDLIIIFLATVIIAGGIFIYRKIESHSTGNPLGGETTADITVCFPVMNAALKNNFAVGDTMLNESHGKLGVITDVKVEPAYINLTASDSNIIKSGKTERYYYPENEFVRITVTFRTENASLNDGRYMIADT